MHGRKGKFSTSLQQAMPYTSWEAGLQLCSDCYRRQISLQQISTPLLLFSQHLCLSRHHMVWNTSLVRLGQFPWLCPLLGSFPPSGYWWGGMLGSHSWCCVSPAQQQPQLWCVLSTFPATTAKHRLWGLLWGKSNPSQTDSVQMHPNFNNYFCIHNEGIFC